MHFLSMFIVTIAMNVILVTMLVGLLRCHCTDPLADKGRSLPYLFKSTVFLELPSHDEGDDDEGLEDDCALNRSSVEGWTRTGVGIIKT
jgi:hypothetical protein